MKLAGVLTRGKLLPFCFTGAPPSDNAENGVSKARWYRSAPTALPLAVHTSVGGHYEQFQKSHVHEPALAMTPPWRLWSNGALHKPTRH